MFSNVMKKMFVLALSLTLVLALVPVTASAAEGTFAEMFSGDITISSDYDADEMGDIAAVTVVEESVTFRVWSTSDGCGYIYNEATITLKNTSGDGLTVKFDFDLKGYYRQVKLGDFTFTTSGVAEVALGIDEEIDITLYSDASNDNEDDVEGGEAVLTLDNFVLTPFHICTGTLVEGEDADCENDGWADYYECSCEKLYADEACTDEITDLDAWKEGDGKIETLGHDYGTLVEEVPAIHTDSELKAGMEAHYHCGRCGTYFTEEKVATTQIELIIPTPSHNYDDQYGYIGDDGHADLCACGAKNAVKPHTPDIPAPTETQDQKCSACGHLIAPKLGHIHENHLTKVEANPASCTDDGNIEYYECSCGKYFEDDSASVEITDKESVVIKAGHNYGELIQEEPAVHTATEQKDGMKAHYFCDECDTYFTADKIKTTKDALVIANTHIHSTEWKSDKDNHWNECACGDKANSTAHNDENSDGKCDVCEYDVGLPTNPDTPQTGDNSNMFLLWIALLFISGAGVVATTVFGKKRFSVK